MAYDEFLANRVRAQLEFYEENFEEKRMFGGLTFLFGGKMTVGIVKDKLAVRVISEKMEGELAKDWTSPMDFTKKPLKEFIYVAPEGVKSESDLLHYIELGLEHAKRKLK
ncbi:TfoX/Sxy family protein [Psychroserpens sp.]|uniref:TfoX/Sxy family protein n=1 Tax=Psychroserpens sp. TaxID=2020870 RepID=UPI001B15F2E4|nr:TfoX/Sxy family protein [Psychroserpens sp.]MBO6606441.1 TfoX/Sxy family protein [Psychroserpens sp.]MBO6653145.1 TfoX/Sxy family protein [Psychroserpens sp.]MBO6680827.1 TfoX/Sxy family protein [Psychroserpens sp.]MBO6750215.1 TfoX/Sxy family protein [Psychroserpens sp.]MBO6914696.1 TfoX/Sxy family protein [Psychroserpens sp.]